MKLRKLVSVLMLLTLAFTLLAGCGKKEEGGGGDADKVYEFNVSFAAPEFSTTALTAVFERMEEASEGRLKFNIFYSWSLTTVPTVVKDLQSGIADIAAMPVHEHSNLFPRNTLVTGTPFMGQADMVEAGEVYAELLKEEPSLLAEYDEVGLHYWTYFYNPPYNIFSTKNAAIATPSELRGSKLIVSENMVQKLIAGNSGAPISAPVTEYFSNLEKGVADGAISHINVINGFGAGPLINSATVFGESGMYLKTMVLAFNADKWNALPDDLKAIFNAEADALALESAIEEDRKVKEGMEELATRADVKVLTDAEMQPWKTAFEPILEEYLDQLEEDGVDNARELYEKAIEKISN